MRSRLRSPGIARNSRLACASTALATLAACSTAADDPGPLPDDTGGIPPTENNGVLLYCENDYIESAGLDDTGGDDGEEPNWVWVKIPQPQLPLPSNVVCTDPAPPNNVLPCYAKMNQRETICYTQEEYELNPNSAWQDGTFPTLDEELRADCSAKCLSHSYAFTDQEVMDNPEFVAQCEDENWSSLHTHEWEPFDAFNCNSKDWLNLGDPDGSLIPWPHEPLDPPALECSLIDDCTSWFRPDVAYFVLPPGISSVIEPETRGAHYLGVEGSGSQLAIDMPGTGIGFDDTEPLFGLAEYTALSCGEDACPFYLASLSAFNATDTWGLAIETVSGLERKSISDVEIDLIQSTLGVHDMSTSTVAFAPGSLRLRVTLTIAGGTTSLGNGTHVALIANDDYVFAEYSAGGLDFEHVFAVQGGTATLTISVEPEEHPPEAEHDLGATEECDHIEGLVLDETRSFSSDPDADIEWERWWVDGEPCGHDCVVPFGSHAISIEATDARGAVNKTADEWVYVDYGSLCATFGP
jgi:hypothetical protein